MSEGTRDQLYLALRLAALELHLGRATALPFVADDLTTTSTTSAAPQPCACWLRFPNMSR